MAYVYWKLVRTPFVSNSYTSDTVDLASFYDPLIRVGTGEGKDSFRFKITNFNDTYDNYFKPNDKIAIYRAYNTEVVSDSDILMIGAVKNVPVEETGSQNMLKIEGYNFSETIMSSIVFIDIANKTIPEAIKAALENAGSKNTNFQVTWNSDNDAAVSSLTFPTIVSERFFNKPLKDVIKKYSTNNTTENGEFYWYVDHNNTLVWRQESTAQDYDFDEATEEYKKLKISKDTNDVRNFIILKGGNDPGGRQIQTKYVNWSSVSKHGLKYLFLISEKNASQLLIEQDIRKSFGDDTPSDNLPDLSSSFTTEWKSGYTYTTKKYSISVTKGSAVTVNEGSEASNKKAYTEVIRAETLKRLVSEGERASVAFQFGKLKIDLEFGAGEKDWNLGSNILCSIPQIDSNPKLMRVREVQYGNLLDTFTLEEI